MTALFESAKEIFEVIDQNEMMYSNDLRNIRRRFLRIFNAIFWIHSGVI